MSTLHCSAVPHTSKPQHLTKKIWSTLFGRNSKDKVYFLIMKCFRKARKCFRYNL
uniref:Uncharacterized protein n=1 Tax=Octopus bimaculoides TaxID=37653 RepID=A0A0L8G338_OCTBM